MLAIAISPLHSLSVEAAGIYVYVDSQGNRLITNRKKDKLQGYTLLKKYQADDYFGSPNRPSNTKFRTRVSHYDKLIVKKARQLGLEPALLKAMIHTESGFNPDALSPKGAKGLMQLMPATAKRYGVVNRGDPIESLEGGGRYMRDLLLLFDHDIRLALAAYNAGENAVKKYNGIPPYNETENYVKKVIALRDQYRKELIGA